MFSYNVGIATYSFSPNINIINNNLNGLCAGHSYSGNLLDANGMMRIYNLDKITAPVDISYLCAYCYNFNQNIKLPPNFINAQGAFSQCWLLQMPVIFKNRNLIDISNMYNYCFNLTDITIDNCNIENASRMFEWAGEMSYHTSASPYNGNDIYIINSNINNAYAMFQGCYNANANFYIQNCNINNGSYMFSYSFAYANEIIMDNVVLNDASYMCSYMYNCPRGASKHFEINIKVNDAVSMFEGWHSYNQDGRSGPIYIDNSNFNICSANNFFTSGAYQLSRIFEVCMDLYFRNSNFYIGHGNYDWWNNGVHYFCRFGWAENSNFIIGDGHAISYPYFFAGGSNNNGGTVQNCNFIFGNNWDYLGESFWYTRLIDNCNFKLGDNWNYTYKLLETTARNDSIIRNTNVTFGNNYNNIGWSTVWSNWVIDCNFNFGDNMNMLYYIFESYYYNNIKINIGNNTNYISYLFGGVSATFFGDVYINIGDNLKKTDRVFSGDYSNSSINYFFSKIGNNIDNLYYPYYINSTVQDVNIIIGNNINQAQWIFHSYSNNIFNLNISIGHNLNNIYYGFYNIGGRDSNINISIGNNINQLYYLIYLKSNTNYFNFNFSLHNINYINTFIYSQSNCNLNGELEFCQVNTIDFLLRSSLWGNNDIPYDIYSGNIYLNNVNCLNGLIHGYIYSLGNIYLNNVRYIENFISYCNFNQNIIFPASLLSLNNTFIHCHNFNQDIIIPYNVTNIYRTFVACENFKNKNINILSPNVSNMQNMIINLVPNGYYQDDSYYNDYGGLRIYVPKDSLTNNTAHNTLNFNSTWTYNNSNNCYYHNNLFVYYI